MKKILRFAFFVLLCCVLVHTPMLAKAACDHAYTETITKKPTCDNVGTATYVCEKCKDTYQNLLFPVHITINEHPQNVRAIKDATATVSVNAVGNEGKTLTYTWYRDQEDTEDDILVKSASNDPTFSVVMNEQWDGSTVYCVITDECGEASGVQTQSALLQMIPEPKITKQPVSTNALLGNEVQVEVEAVGEGLTYQWYYANKGEDSFTK